MARNIGEALGVGGAVKLANNLSDEVEYTVNIKNLDWIERFLGGDQPLPTYTAGTEKATEKDKQVVVGGLAPGGTTSLRRCRRPWCPGFNSDVPGIKKIDKTQQIIKRARLCTRPQLPRVSPALERRAANGMGCQRIRLLGEGPAYRPKFLKLHVIDLDTVGTDPNQAVNFYRRFAVVPNPLQNPKSYGPSGTTQTISAEAGLYRITSLIRQDYFKKNQLFPVFDERLPSADPKKEERWAYDRYRTLPEYAGEAAEKGKPNSADRTKAVSGTEIF